MDERVVRALKRISKEINNNMNFIIEGNALTDEIVKGEFAGIRILLDVCEYLVLAECTSTNEKIEKMEERKMTEAVVSEIKKQVKVINQNFEFIINDKLPTEELIKLEFEGIRILVDYCEKLALEGESAIEEI